MEFFKYFLISLLFIASFIPASHQERRNFVVSGTVKCFDSESRNVVPFANSQVVLYEDENLSDNVMGKAQTDGNGQFSITGFGGDYLSQPDPYLYFVHACGIPICESSTYVYLDGSGGEHKDLKIVLGNGKEEAKDGQGNLLKMETENHGNEECESLNG